MEEEKAKCYREEYWGEKAEDEKIEFLKRELKRTQGYIEKMSEYLEALLEHQHVANTILTPIKTSIPYYVSELCFRVEEFK